MNHIAHENIFEYLAVDLDTDEDSLKEKLKSMGTQSFISYLKNKELSLYKTQTVLSTELRDMLGNVLINKDIPLDKYLDTLLDRYVSDEDFITSPFAIQTSDEILRIYRGKVTTKINGEIDKMLTTQDKYKKFYAMLQSGELKAKDQFDGFMRSLMVNSDGISFMLKMIKSIDGNMEIFVQTTNSTFICIALALMHINKTKSVNQKVFLDKVACASFLQNSGVFTGLVTHNADPAEGAKKSAMIASKLCNDEYVTEAIRERTNYQDAEGTPVFGSVISRKNFHKSLLMTANLFVDIVKKNRFSPESIEVHKAMYELAKQGYADPKIVSLISELFLPRLKHQLLEYAFKIQDQCKEKPVIWGVAGDMLPIKFICGLPDCKNAGNHKTLIPQDVEIIADKIYETKTKADIYYTCDLLTGKLQEYYKSIQKEFN